MSEALDSGVVAGDILECAREPIHTPNQIQPHGVLLALRRADGPVRRASENTTIHWSRPARAILGARLTDLFGAAQGEQLVSALADPRVDKQCRFLRVVRVGAAMFNAIGHRWNDEIVLELEPAAEGNGSGFADLYPLVSAFTARLQEAQGLDELCQLTAREVRQLTGFDRVLIYRFDEDRHGTVVAEDRNQRLPSYLDLRFPESDIPSQARQLYLQNRTRLIADADYRPTDILAAAEETGEFDMSFATLRSVSPAHVAYMKNMGTAASLSISIVLAGRLWGLISCHHRRPRFVPFEARAACDSLGQVFALQLAAFDSARLYERRLELRAGHAGLLSRMATADDFVEGLVSDPQELCRFVDASGAAVLARDRCHLIGKTPTEAEVRSIAAWLFEQPQHEVFASHEMVTVAPPATGLEATASGVLAVSISQVRPDYVMWFRPEVPRTVKWGGDPRKPMQSAKGGQEIGPRNSFETWKETVRGKSTPWTHLEQEAARELRNSIVGIVLRTAEERAELTSELQRSNKELEAFSYSVSHDLRAPFRHIVGYSELLREHAGDRLDELELRYINTVIESAHYAGALVDNLLTFSRMGRARLDKCPVDLAALVAEIRQELATETQGRRVEWSVGPLPRVKADLMMMRAALQNLLANALKYTRDREEARIEVGSHLEGDALIVTIRDNGVGFDMAYVDKLFGVFQRLHRPEEFEGTGIGLANVRRIIARHGGRTWAEGRLGEGASFSFSLPGELLLLDAE